MFDIVIVGKGVIGLSCAFKLSKHFKVCVIDTSSNKPGASQAAAGIIFPNSSTRSKGKLGVFNFQAMNHWDKWTEELEIELRNKKELIQIFSDIEEHDHWKSQFEAEPYTNSITDLKIPSKEKALLLKNVSTVNTKNYLEILELLCKNNSVSFIEAETIKLNKTKNQIVSVLLSNGKTVKGNNFIVACGAYKCNWLPSETRPEIIPQLGESFILQTTQKWDHPFIGTPNGSIIPRKNNEIWAGVTAISNCVDMTPTLGSINSIASNILKYFPVLKTAYVKNIMSGIRPVSADGMPHIGKTVYDNMFLAMGAGRDGILQSGLTANIVYDSIVNKKENSLVSPLNRNYCF